MAFNIKEHLPTELHKFESDFSKLVQETIKVSLNKTAPKHSWSSKVGGFPYLLIGTEYPKGSDGELLNFVAQINFSEIPELEHFPREGLVQFFVGSNDMYGLDFDDPTTQSNFKVIYHENVETDATKLVTDFSFVKAPKHSPFNSPTSHSLVFGETKECISTTDFRFEKSVMEGIFSEIDEDTKYDLVDTISEKSLSNGHKIGGYPHFTQEDPRADSHEILLLQIDTDHDFGVMWGDSGIANFFINAEDLADADFSNVLYNWDCL
jgi:uncharacterized protein YwqG